MTEYDLTDGYDARFHVVTQFAGNSGAIWFSYYQLVTIKMIVVTFINQCDDGVVCLIQGAIIMGVGLDHTIMVVFTSDSIGLGIIGHYGSSTSII